MAHWINDYSLDNLIDDLKSQLSKHKEISIIGHDNIDVDSCLAGILLSKLLHFFGIKNEFVILQPVKNDDTFQIIKKLLGININIFYCPIEDDSRNLFLVDHYETSHLGHVIGCIDHHPTLQKNTYDFSYVRKSTSTTYMIYELMHVLNYPVSKEDALMIIVGMMVDTVAFCSSKALLNEINNSFNLASEFDIDFDYLKKETMCLTQIETMTLQEIIFNGLKKYNYNGVKIASSYLQLYGVPSKAQIKRWINAINKETQDLYDMFVFLIFDLKDIKTYEYHITTHLFDSIAPVLYIKKTTHNGILSRGQDIMPNIEKLFTLSDSDKVDKLIKNLTAMHKTLASMESCTGGSFAGTITNHSGASDILQESLVSYSNRAKIEFGVPENIIDTYTVYSPETAREMAKAVKRYCKSNIGIGITGRLCTSSSDIDDDEANIAWYAIEKDNDGLLENSIKFLCNLTRPQEKELIIKEIINDLFALYC